MQNLKDYFTLIKLGLYGFIVFFSVLVLAKLFNWVIFKESEFVIELGDILLSMLGFIYVIFIQLVKEIKKGEDLEKN